MKMMFLLLTLICLMPLSAVAASSEQDKAFVLIQGPKAISYTVFCNSNIKNNKEILIDFVKWTSINYSNQNDIAKLFLNTVNENNKELISLAYDDLLDNNSTFSQNIKNQCPEIIARRDKIIKILQQE